MDIGQSCLSTLRTLWNQRILRSIKFPLVEKLSTSDIIEINNSYQNISDVHLFLINVSLNCLKSSHISYGYIVWLDCCHRFPLNAWNKLASSMTVDSSKLIIIRAHGLLDMCNFIRDFDIASISSNRLSTIPIIVVDSLCEYQCVRDKDFVKWTSSINTIRSTHSSCLLMVNHEPTNFCYKTALKNMHMFKHSSRSVNIKQLTVPRT
ncbi:hypothetical protein GJ496_009041 [Pomphorhynchus laevis]|nr:hypothetical protein GJ496_009041 [Pomphorhynchus laevis]